MHAQLIEVVSELLRERLGPTSEYVQSLIEIQSAYINTNHPAFVNDSANIATRMREEKQRKTVPEPPRHEISLDSDLGTPATEEDEDDKQNQVLIMNGAPHTKRAMDAFVGSVRCV